MRPRNESTSIELHPPDQKRHRPSPSAATGYNKTKRDAEMLTKVFEKALDVRVVEDIFRVTHGHPTIIKCANQFNSLILCRPFKVHLASFAKDKMTETPEFARHIAKFWMPWVRSLFLWRQMYGIVPWRIMPVDGSDGRFWYPEIPDFDAGYITTWLDPKTKQQRFHYYWHGQPMSEPAPMYWSHSEWQPTCAGRMRSPINSILAHFSTEHIVRNATEVAAYHAARPSYFWLRKSNTKTDAMSAMPALNPLGEDIVGNFDDRAAKRFATAAAVHSTAFENELNDMTRKNNGAAEAARALQKPMLYSESPTSIAEREGSGIAQRSYYMPPDWELGKPTEPKALVDLDKMDERLTKHACEAMGIPQELTQGGKTTTASTAGIFFVMNEKVKMETAWLNSEIEYAMLLCYGDVWNDGYDEIKRHVSAKNADEKYGKFMMRTANIDISIQLDCVPLLTGDQAKELWRDGFMNKDDAAQILQGQYLIPEELVHVLAMPDRDPQTTLAQEAQRAKMVSKSKTASAGKPKAKKPKAASEKRPTPTEEERVK